MRASVLLWSLAGGAVLGLLAGFLLFAIVFMTGEVPGAIGRIAVRLRAPAAVLCFVVLPAIGGVLGWMEGKLKLR